MRIHERLRNDEPLRIQCMAYAATQVVLAVRRDPSIERPSDDEELWIHLLLLADRAIAGHPGFLCIEDLPAVISMMRGIWEADKEVGTELRVG